MNRQGQGADVRAGSDVGSSAATSDLSHADQALKKLHEDAGLFSRGSNAGELSYWDAFKKPGAEQLPNLSIDPSKESGGMRIAKTVNLLNDSGGVVADDSQWNTKPTDLYGKDCKSAKPGEFANLRSGVEDKGCHFDSNHGVKDVPKEQIDSNIGSVVHIHTPIRSGKITDDQRGSGVIIGHGDDVTYVASVNHNFTTYENDHNAVDQGTGKPIVKDGLTKVEMPDGTKYEARQIDLPGEKGTDRTVLAVHTGDRTGKFTEAHFAESSNYKGRSYAVGFPGDARSPYVSPMVARGLDIGNHGEMPRVLTAHTGRSVEGMSGGPIFNRNGEVYSLDQSNEGPSRANGTPIDRATVERWRQYLPTRW